MLGKAAAALAACRTERSSVSLTLSLFSGLPGCNPDHDSIPKPPTLTSKPWSATRRCAWPSFQKMIHASGLASSGRHRPYLSQQPTTIRLVFARALQARMEILKIHASGLAKSGDIDYEAVVKLADSFNGADLRNICTEAGMFAIRDERDYTVHEDFMKVRSWLV